MTILQGDIKLIAAQVMSDTEVGGGGPSPNAIPDGVSNAIFPDISELDRAIGRVNLRKVFPFIDTETSDGFYGANVIVAKPYEDPRVSVTLFTTNDHFDRRPEAASRMESYLAKGATYSGYLFGNHIAGQQTVALLQRLEVADPVVGSTLVLTKNEGLGTEFQQYIRVTSVSVTERTFTDNQEDFVRKQVILEISDPLQQDFFGFEAIRTDANLSYTGKTRISDTIVADAARYYGTVPLREAASLGDYTLRGEGIYTQLVPSTRVEVPISDARMNQQIDPLIAAGPGRPINLTLTFTTSQAMYVGGGILPGALTIERDGITLTDQGGVLLNGSTQVGNVDYANGIVSLTTNVFGTGPGNHTVTYTPASRPTIVSHTHALEVTQESQRLTWTISLEPVPAKGTLNVSYRSLGRWYVLTEDGSGAIRGSDAAYGAGTLNFTTGTVSLTLGAMPDVDSKIVLAWAPAASSTTVAAVPQQSSALPRAFEARFFLPTSLKPGTLTLTWNDGQARTATDSNGALTGSAQGAVTYGGMATVRMIFPALPAKGTIITATVTEATPQIGSILAFSDGGANWTFNLGGSAKARSVEFGVVGQYPVRSYPGTDENTKELVRIFDDGAGNLKIANVTSNDTIGSVDYVTGNCTILKTFSGFKSYQPVFEKKFPLGAGASYIEQTGYETRSLQLTILNGTGGTTLAPPTWAWWTGAMDAAAKYRYAGSDGAAAQTYTFPLESLEFHYAMMPTYPGSPIYTIPGFTLGGVRHRTFGEGGETKIERDPSPASGRGTQVGTAGSVLRLTDWTTGISPIPTLLDGSVSPPLTGPSGQVVGSVVFRTAIAPLLNGGFNLVGLAKNGTQFNVTANNAGVISTGNAPIEGGTAGDVANLGSDGVFGFVDYENGIAEVFWGRRVPANWPANDTRVIDISHLTIPGVTRIMSSGVQADSLRYNAVGYSYLPLDPDILGLNPVRLPADGRVPIFRPGSVIVIGNQQVLGPQTVSNGQVLNMGRNRLSRVRVVGSNGAVIDTGYSANLDTGLVTFTNVAGYSQPIRVEHRVEDMLLVSGVQLNGDLTCTRPVSHDYPLEDTYISSALVIGDMQAYVGTIFDQGTWNNVWSDTLSGSPAAGTFDDATFPILVNNRGALTERWAVQFTSNIAFNVIGEHVGVIATGSTGTDCAPLNPRTGEPYFTIPSEGWGLGWSVGNVLRFNTIGAQAPVWLARTILQGPETVIDDSFLLLTRGDVDRP